MGRGVGSMSRQRLQRLRTDMKERAMAPSVFMSCSGMEARGFVLTKATSPRILGGRPLHLGVLLFSGYGVTKAAAVKSALLGWLRHKSLSQPLPTYWLQPPVA